MFSLRGYLAKGLHEATYPISSMVIGKNDWINPQYHKQKYKTSAISFSLEMETKQIFIFWQIFICTLTSMGKGMSVPLHGHKTEASTDQGTLDAIFNLMDWIYYSVDLLSNVYNTCFLFLTHWKFAEIHILCVFPAERSIHNSTIYWLLSILQNLIFTCDKCNMISTLTNVYYSCVT